VNDTNSPPTSRNGRDVSRGGGNNLNGPGGPTGPGDGGPRVPRFRLSSRGWIITIAVVLLFNFIFYLPQLANTTTKGAETALNYSTFLAQVRSNDIHDAQIRDTAITGAFKRPYTLTVKGKATTYTRYSTVIAPELLSSTVALMDRHGAQVTLENTTSPAWVTVIGSALQALPLLFLLGLFFIGSRAARQQQQGVFGFGRSKAKLYTEERPHTTFSDVAGVDAAKDELKEIVDFLRDPSVYHRIGARIPKGVLLIGPPGTGKTLLARAVAGEAHVAFFSISATEFVEMFVGVGASRVRDLFDRAKQAAPAIVFVDELDAIGGSRGGRGPLAGSNDEREQTLNQLLVSMDGFEPNEAVIILAATNRPDVLDPALLRPGRFDRQVVIDPPDRKGREAILRIHTQQIPLDPKVDLGTLAQGTPGMSGADLANLANEAALTAARNHRTEVTQADFEQALDRITLGSVGAPLMNEEERRTVAYHEAGHAIVAFLLPNVDPVQRITITPRGRSLGVTQFLPVDERRNYRRDYLLNRMAVGLGGRSAEEVVFEDITSGAQNDIQMVTGIARTMVTELGMVDEFGPTYLGAGGDGLNGGSYNPFDPKEHSDETAAQIDAAVNRLVQEAHARALAILRDNRPPLDAVAAALIHDESLDRVQFTDIVNQHRSPGRPELPVPTGEATPTGEHPEVVQTPLGGSTRNTQDGAM
jgi:cell division protease FtsH